jgi:predicted ATPase/class 3 adenylate cyclase/tetratricopeptide (TPR) repeat protein
MVSGLPTGVVTLLFTDVEGSTRLLRELGDGYGEALHEHRRRLRAAFANHGGIEVDTQGDAFFVAFARASNAVAAAADGQRALADGPIRVRMGLHTGEPRLTEEGYIGLDVHKGARIAAVGHGGQVLLSQTTHALVDANARDLGVHRLKDLSAPEHIYQLEIEGLRCDFPLLKTIEAGMKNLPSPRTSFVGRASELDEIDRLLGDSDCRLLTLVGPGGAGKTRLALEAAARRIERYQHGVHFVPLVAVASPELLASAVAESIQFAVDGAHSGFSPQDQLLDYLSERSTLLVLDNFEHLVDGTDLLGDIIERAPKVELLTTSRERLNLQSEWVIDVHGLGLRDNGNGGSGALRLFAERATRVEPAFSLDDQRAEAHRICMLVEGLPLGIELAASWVSVLSCAEIANEIEQNIDFLATSMRDVPERHRSLRAAFDQSWRLLSGKQQEVLARLSMLRGDFDRVAAAAVAGADVRLLSDLVSKSLVRRSDFGRYELHELLRQYSAEKLAAESSDALASTRERHARHYLGALNERRAALVGKGIVQARDELRRELDNLRVAAEWAVATWTEDEARGVLAGLNEFFFAHSWYDGAETFKRLAAVASDASGQAGQFDRASPVALACVANRTCLGSGLGYDEELDRLALECLPGLRDHGMTRELGWCLLALGINACYRDVYPDAAGYLEEAVALVRKAGDQLGEAGSLSWLGFVQLLMGDNEGARSSFEACRTAAERPGNPQMLAYALSKLGILADAEERYADAMRLHMEANELFTAVGDAGGAGYTLSRASLSAYGMEDYEEALRLGRAGYEAFSEVNHRWGMIAALCRIGFAALALGGVDEAQRTFCTALERAHASAAISLELLALSGVGAVLRATGQREQAATVLTFALGHEQLPPSYSITARPALEALEAELSSEQLAGVRLAATAASLEDLITRALEPTA